MSVGLGRRRADRIHVRTFDGQVLGEDRRRAPDGELLGQAKQLRWTTDTPGWVSQRFRPCATPDGLSARTHLREALLADRLLSVRGQ